MRKFSAVIFDFGGVITASPFEAFARLEAERGLPPGLVRRINTLNPDGNAWARLERSEIDTATFDTLFAEEAAALGHVLPGRDVLSVIAGKVRPEMVTALGKLRGAGYRLGCITNNMRSEESKPGVGAMGPYAEAMGHFEHVIESATAGVRKPDPRIYAMMCQALALPPEACVYLDDLGINCKPAAAMGMHAIKVTSGAQALVDLGAALGMELA
ncbi:HAD-IA family hydrolase [Novosphingobium sp. G106]|nr:HAD-IA family hydrolase [Novosphingobium sp. G106]